jgi:hypothetical protein
MKSVGPFKETSSVGYQVYGCEDWDFWLRMARAGHLMDYVPGVVVHNHWHLANMSYDKRRMRRSHLWVLLEAALNLDDLNFKHRHLLGAQITYRHFEYLKCAYQEDPTSLKTVDRSPPMQPFSFLSALPYAFSHFGSDSRPPRLASWLAYLIGKMTQKLLW